MTEEQKRLAKIFNESLQKSNAKKSAKSKKTLKFIKDFCEKERLKRYGKGKGGKGKGQEPKARP